MITVGIVEDLKASRERFSSVVRTHPKLELLGTAGNVAEGVQILADEAPDVLLVDLGLPDGNGIELIHYIRNHNLDTQALVISIFGDELTVVPALEAGAQGYLLKDHPAEDIPQAIFQLIDGGAPISPVIAKQMLKRFRRSVASNADIEQLTKRERDVLEMVSRGYTSVEIAEKMCKSYHTITTHVRNIYRKLAVNSRAEAVSKAMQFGLLDDE